MESFRKKLLIGFMLTLVSACGAVDDIKKAAEAASDAANDIAEAAARRSGPSASENGNSESSSGSGSSASVNWPDSSQQESQTENNFFACEDSSFLGRWNSPDWSFSDRCTFANLDCNETGTFIEIDSTHVQIKINEVGSHTNPTNCLSQGTWNCEIIVDTESVEFAYICEQN